MFGLIVAVIAAGLLCLTLKINVKNEDVPKENRPQRVKPGKLTSALVRLLEDDNAEEIQRSIENGINVALPFSNGRTSLMIAVKNNEDPKVVSLLIKNGVNINETDDSGQTALIIAAKYNPNPDVVKKLLKQGADKTITDKSGKKAADYADGNPAIPSDLVAVLKLR